MNKLVNILSQFASAPAKTVEADDMRAIRRQLTRIEIMLRKMEVKPMEHGNGHFITIGTIVSCITPNGVSASSMLKAHDRGVVIQCFPPQEDEGHPLHIPAQALVRWKDMELHSLIEERYETIYWSRVNR